MLNELHIGRRESYTNPSSTTAITPGSVVSLVALSTTEPGRIGVVVDTIGPSATGVIQVLGVVSLPKNSGDAYTQGQAAYWDAATGTIALTSATNANAWAGRIADSAFAAGTTTAHVNLNVH
ncbi:MAG: capsid cement protein [Phycisphaerae bacterium]